MTQEMIIRRKIEWYLKFLNGDTVEVSHALAELGHIQMTWVHIVDYELLDVLRIFKYCPRNGPAARKLYDKCHLIISRQRRIDREMVKNREQWHRSSPDWNSSSDGSLKRSVLSTLKGPRSSNTGAETSLDTSFSLSITSNESASVAFTSVPKKSNEAGHIRKIKSNASQTPCTLFGSPQSQNFEVANVICQSGRKLIPIDIFASLSVKSPSKAAKRKTTTMMRSSAKESAVSGASSAKN